MAVAVSLRLPDRRFPSVPKFEGSGSDCLVVTHLRSCGSLTFDPTKIVDRTRTWGDLPRTVDDDSLEQELKYT